MFSYCSREMGRVGHRSSPSATRAELRLPSVSNSSSADVDLVASQKRGSCFSTNANEKEIIASGRERDPKRSQLDLLGK